MRHLVTTFFLIFSHCLLSGCGKTGGGPPQGFAVPVVVASVSARTFNPQVTAVGELTPFERVEIRSELAGKVLSVRAEEGDLVAKGEALITLNDEIVSARLEEAEAAYELAKAEQGRARQLLGSQTISAQEADRAESTYLERKAALSRLTAEADDAIVAAPFKGMLGRRLVSEGQYVKEGEALWSLVALDPLRVDFEIPERFALEMKRGLSVQVGVQDRQVSGKIYFVSPEIDSATRTILIRAKIPNGDLALRPGLLVQGRIPLSEQKRGYAVPESTLIQQGDAVFVYRVKEDASVERVDVKVERLEAGQVIVSGDLIAGDKLVKEGHQKIAPGMKVAASQDEG